jgi:hypothetical protein
LTRFQYQAQAAAAEGEFDEKACWPGVPSDFKKSGQVFIRILRNCVATLTCKQLWYAHTNVVAEPCP